MFLNHLLPILQTFCAGDPGRSVCMWTENEYAHVNGTVPRPAASVMKVPLFMTLYDLERQGRIDMQSRLARKEFPGTLYCSILQALHPDTMLTLDEYCALGVITSDNPVAAVLQDRVSLSDVNALLACAGCTEKTRMDGGFRDGEITDLRHKNRMTACDAVTMFRAVREGEAYARLRTALKNNLRNNRIPANLPDSAAIYHKTGTVQGVVNDAGWVEDRGVFFFMAALTENQPDPNKTCRDIALCAEQIYNVLKG